MASHAVSSFFLFPARLNMASVTKAACCYMVGNRWAYIALVIWVLPCLSRSETAFTL